MKIILVLLLSSLLLAGCGQTGRLYLPDPNHPQTVESDEG